MKKKILLLGGSYGQIPAIDEAKRRGLYTILCDYLPENPGKDLVDEFHLVSSTDVEKVLEVATGREVDYILAYASDPAALTAACVSEKMNLPGGNDPKSVELLSMKNLFRNFQDEHRFHAPRFNVFSPGEQAQAAEASSLLPGVVKPVDGSDTKGISLVKKASELAAACDLAYKYSRCGKIIIEEEVDHKLARLHGDAFVVNGKVAFCELGDHLYTSVSAPLKPSCTAFTSRVEKKQVQRVKKVLTKLIRKSGFKNGPLNVEARINSKNRVFIMEVGPRSGGSFVPQCIYESSGVDMLKAQFDMNMGYRVDLERTKLEPAVLFTLHSNRDGIFRGFRIHKDLEPFMVKCNLHIMPGQPVKSYKKPGSAIGALIFNFKNPDYLEAHKNNLYQKIMSGVAVEDSE